MMHSNLIDKKLIFCVLFSIISSISYLICDLYKLPLFTYYPAVDEFALGFAKMTETQGPAMYWYGWICTASAFAAPISLIAVLFAFSKKATNLISNLVWILIWVLLPIFINSLNFYWYHA